MRNDFIFCSGDTDGLKFLKPDHSEFTKEEIKEILNHLNCQMPEHLVLEDDGYYDSFVTLKTKNYIYRKDGKITFKGSSIVSSSKEFALLEMMKRIGTSLLEGVNYEEIIKIYLEYIKEAQNVKDIKRWVTKKTASPKVMNSETDPKASTTCKKVLRAIKHLNPQEGDKVYVYDAIDGMIQEVKKGELQFKKDGEPKMIPNRILKTIDQYDNDYIPSKLMKRVLDTIDIFDTILAPMVEIHVPKKNLKSFGKINTLDEWYKYINRIYKGEKVLLDTLTVGVLEFIKYCKAFPEVKIREISRFKSLVGELEEE